MQSGDRTRIQERSPSNRAKLSNPIRSAADSTSNNLRVQSPRPPVTSPFRHNKQLRGDKLQINSSVGNPGMRIR